MVLKDSNINIYFCTNMLDVVSIENDLISDLINVDVTDKNLFSLNSLKCAECNDESSIECKLNLFDIKTFMIDLKKSIGKDRLNMHRHSSKENKSKPIISSISNTQNYLFYTQTDAEYYAQPASRTSSIDTQYMKVNSILDALENIGYYGFVTFRATIQRIGIFLGYKN